MCQSPEERHVMKTATRGRNRSWLVSVAFHVACDLKRYLTVKIRVYYLCVAQIHFLPCTFLIVVYPGNYCKKPDSMSIFSLASLLTGLGLQLLCIWCTSTLSRAETGLGALCVWPLRLQSRCRLFRVRKGERPL